MARKGSSDVAVGAMFALALVILALSIMAVGEGSSIFRSKVEYFVVFPQVEGLAQGSPVKMAGVQVGTVSGILLPTDPAHEGIRVRLGVDANYSERVREGSEATLRILQVLSGEKFVEILPGKPELAVMPAGSEIPPHDDPDMFAAASEASQNINTISVSLKNILGKLERGEGILGQMIQDPEFGVEGLEALKGALNNLEALTGDLHSGRGFAGRLIADETFAAKVDSLGETIDGLGRVMARIDGGEGAIGELLRADGSGERAVRDLADAAASLKRIAQGLESDSGLLGRLLNDEAYSERLATHLDDVLGNLAEITDKINRGDGTLGALVNERTLYEGMEDVVAGVNDSKFARWLMRHYQKKGIKSAAEEDSTPGSR